MKKYLYLIIAIFCAQHLVRDYLQLKGLANWYTTFGHTNFIPDTQANNIIGMIIFFCLSLMFFNLFSKAK